MSALTEFTDWIEPAIAGWRYLLSPDYRARKRADWQHEHLAYVALDIAGGVIGVAITLTALVVITLLLFGPADPGRFL